MESPQSYRVGWSALIRGPTPWLTVFAVTKNSCRACSTGPGARVESTQSHRVGWSALIRGPTPWLTEFAVTKNSCRACSTGPECINKRAHSMVDSVRCYKE